ncbi:MAG: hypothetical protein KAZ87_01175 [Spirochaetes bacterium]|nr:hypothetical protein [Spirochaetota bacterium]
MNSRVKKDSFSREIEFRKESAKWERNMIHSIVSNPLFREANQQIASLQNYYFKAAAFLLAVAVSAMLIGKVFSEKDETYSAYVISEETSSGYFSYDFSGGDF